MKGIWGFGFCLGFLGGLCVSGIFAGAVWVAKVNDDVTITVQEFDDAYRATVFMSAMSSPVPVSDAQIQQILTNKTQRKRFLQQYIDQTLIIQKAKEKRLYRDKDIQKQITDITHVLKRQLIVKRFTDKIIYPKVTVSKSEVDGAYKAEKKKKSSPIHKLPPAQAKQYIQSNLQGRKLIRKLQEYTERLRLESKIIQNDKRL